MNNSIKEWIELSPHKPYCEQAPGNIYSSHGPCNCGRDDALNSVASLLQWKEIADQMAIAIQAFKRSDEWNFGDESLLGDDHFAGQMNNALDAYHKANPKPT